MKRRTRIERDTMGPVAVPADRLWGAQTQRSLHHFHFPDETMPIEENMHFAVHPGYNTSTMWTTICDNYMVGAKGVGDCLHKTEKKIFEVG